MAFFKSTRNSPGPLIAVNTTNSNNDSGGNQFSDIEQSPNLLQSNSLESLQNLWDIDPELPRNMYMPCIATSDINTNNIGSNRIYILGSHKNNQCWVYDGTYKTYENLPYFPKKIIPKGHCVASCENIIFSTGGSTQSKHLLFFNTISNEWHTAPNSRAKDFGIGSKCIAIKNKSQQIELHVVGGNRKPNKYYIYNRALKTWGEGPKLPLKLTYHGLVHVGRNNERQNNNNNGRKSVRTYLRDHRSQLIIFGGCNVKKGWTSTLSPTTKMYRLYLEEEEEEDDDDDDDDEEKKEEEEENKENDINNQHNNYKWRYLGDLPVAVQNFGYLCVLNNYILIFGGDLGELKCSRNIYMYNIEKKRWKLLGIKLPDHLYGMTSIETRNGIIHIFGGHNGKTSQRLHLSIKTSKLLQKEFDEFDSTLTWKQLSLSSGNNNNINNNDNLSLLDELKRVKRKLKDLEGKYNLTILQYEQLNDENEQIKNTNINILDKLAEAMQEKEEISYEIQEIKRRTRSKSPSKSVNSPRTPRNDKSSKKKQMKKKKKKKYRYNPYIDTELMNELRLESNNNYNIDPKYVMFRNFLFGRIGLPQYLNDFQSSRYSNICKMTMLNDECLSLKIGISNELHRKLILKTINEFKLEILQFKSWITSYDKEPNLICYIKPFAKYGIISWHLLSQHISNKKDFKNKLFVDDDEAIECLYHHLIQYLNGQIPKPNPNKNKIQQIIHDGDHHINHIHDINHTKHDNDNALFDDSGYHNW